MFFFISRSCGGRPDLQEEDVLPDREKCFKLSPRDLGPSGVWLAYPDGGPTLGTRGDGLFPTWLGVNLSVYPGREWSVTPVFETEGVVSGR